MDLIQKNNVGVNLNITNKNNDVAFCYILELCIILEYSIVPIGQTQMFIVIC